MEKFLENIQDSTEYKIVLKNNKTPIYAYITSADSKFLYLKFPDAVPFILSVDEVHTIIPSRGGSR